MKDRGGVNGVERDICDPVDLARLLRVSAERRGEHRSEASDEGSTVHSII